MSSLRTIYAGIHRELGRAVLSQNNISFLQGDHKVSVHLMITIQKAGAQRPFDHPAFPHAACPGPGSSVGIATELRVNGPGSNPGGEEIFRTRPDRPWGPASLL